jgi:hypothetical protein
MRVKPVPPSDSTIPADWLPVADWSSWSSGSTGAMVLVGVELFADPDGRSFALANAGSPVGRRLALDDGVTLHRK